MGGGEVTASLSTGNRPFCLDLIEFLISDVPKWNTFVPI